MARPSLIPSAGGASRGSRARPPDLCRVLLVEDNEGDVVLIREFLDDVAVDDQSLRFELTWTRDLASAESMLAEQLFDAVLLDLSLPDAAGLDGLEALTTAAPRIPVIVLTGDRRSQVARTCLTRGAQDYLLKGAIDGHALRRSIGFAMLRQREELARLERAHDDRLRSVGMLAAGVAHELNTPAMYVSANLESVAGWLAQLPVGDDAAQEARQAIEDALEGVQRMADIVSRLREFSRVESPESVRVNLNAVVRKALAMTQSQVPQGALDVRYAPNLPPIVGYRSRLAQILVNLLVNAGHAVVALPVPRIGVSVKLDGDTQEVTVRDNGCGMSSAQMKRVFDPFYTTKPVGEGTGLGLALSREIARQHGGTLEASSEPGEGSTFVLRIPSDTGLEDATPTSLRPSAGATRRRRLLIVDDEAALVRGLRRLLRNHHDVTGVVGGQAALEALAEDDRYDVVLCDMLMPGVDGRHVLAHIETHHPHLRPRFVYLTGGSKGDAGPEGDGMPPVVQKPVTRERLLRVLDKF